MKAWVSPMHSSLLTLQTRPLQYSSTFNVIQDFSACTNR